MSAPQCKKINPVGLEPPAGVRNKRKYCENMKKPTTSNSFLDPEFLLLKIRLNCRISSRIISITGIRLVIESGRISCQTLNKKFDIHKRTAKAKWHLYSKNTITSIGSKAALSGKMLDLGLLKICWRMAFSNFYRVPIIIPFLTLYGKFYLYLT